ncbi:MAG: hypothetical protein AAF329_18625 [Cyanobacteria bacterium P01_A01_bin.17]
MLLSTGLLGACGPVTESRSDGTAQASDKEEKPDRVLQPFESIAGTPYLVANITQADWGGSRSGSSGSYKRGAGDIHNLVFLDSGSLASHRLFETNQYNILEAKQYPLSNANPQAKKEEKIARFVYQVFKQDTNEDDYLGGADHRTIGISDAFGKQYVEVLTDISQLLNLKPLSSNRLLAVYVKAGQKTASIIDLEQRVVVKTDAIATLGPDVQ